MGPFANRQLSIILDFVLSNVYKLFREKLASICDAEIEIIGRPFFPYGRGFPSYKIAACLAWDPWRVIAFA